MYFCYVDETGTQDRLRVLSVILEEDRVMDLHDLHRDLLHDVWPVTRGWSQGPQRQELHAADIFHAKDVWKGIDPDARVDAYERTLALLSDVGAKIIHATINVDVLNEQYSDPDDPQALAMQFLAEKIHDWLPSDARAIIVADRTDAHARYVHERVQRMQATGDPFFGEKLTKVVDTVFFVESYNSPGVQLADMAAFAWNRKQFIKEKDDPTEGDAAMADLWSDHVRDRVVRWRMPWPRRKTS